MAIPKTPLFGLKAQGTIGKALTYQNRNSATMVRAKPSPVDPRTLAQVYHRWDYQDYAYLWTQLSVAEKQQWRSDARRQKITGFNYFMSDRLKTLPDLVLRWHLDPATGSLVPDTSRNALNGTLFGPSYTPGIIDGALDFDGVDDYAQVPQNTLYQLTDKISLEAFIYLKELCVSNIVIGTTVVWSAGYSLWMTNLNRITNPIVTTAGVDGGSSGLLELNRWYHFCFTYDKDGGANNCILYQDGIPIDPRTTTGPIIQPGSPFSIGRYAAWPTHPCLIDEVRLYNRVLDATEILRHAERRYP